MKTAQQMKTDMIPETEEFSIQIIHTLPLLLVFDPNNPHPPPFAVYIFVQYIYRKAIVAAPPETRNTAK
jgi:hypothetical protein